MSAVRRASLSKKHQPRAWPNRRRSMLRAPCGRWALQHSDACKNNMALAGRRSEYQLNAISGSRIAPKRIRAAGQVRIRLKRKKQAQSGSPSHPNHRKCPPQNVVGIKSLGGDNPFAQPSKPSYLKSCIRKVKSVNLHCSAHRRMRVNRVAKLPSTY